MIGAREMFRRQVDVQVMLSVFGLDRERDIETETETWRYRERATKR